LRARTSVRFPCVRHDHVCHDIRAAGILYRGCVGPRLADGIRLDLSPKAHRIEHDHPLVGERFPGVVVHRHELISACFEGVRAQASPPLRRAHVQHFVRVLPGVPHAVASLLRLRVGRKQVHLDLVLPGFLEVR